MDEYTVTKAWNVKCCVFTVNSDKKAGDAVKDAKKEEQKDEKKQAKEEKKEESKEEDRSLREC